MTSQENINEYFTKNHERIRALTCVYLNTARRSDFCPEAFISEAFLYITERKDTIKPEEIEPFTLKFISNEVKWKVNGRVSKMYKMKDVLLGRTVQRRNSQVDGDTEFESEQVIEDREDITAEEREEMFISIEEVYKNEQDKVKQIVHDVFVNKGKITSRSMAAHFGITHVSAHELIRNLKSDIHEKHKSVHAEARI